MSGRLPIPLSISFFPRPEFIAFEPIVRPRFAMVLGSPLPDFNLLYSFLILQALSCVGVFPRLNLTLFFLILGACLFLGPTILVLVILMFPGKLLLLILSYLAKKDVPSGSLTRLRIARRPSTIFSLIFIFSYACHQKNFFNKGFATSPRKGAAVDAISPKGIAPPLCLLLYRLLLHPIYQKPFLTDCFPLILINHHQFD